MEETSISFEELFQMKTEIDHLNEQLTARTDYESGDYMKLIERVDEFSEKFYAIEVNKHSGQGSDKYFDVQLTGR